MAAPATTKATIRRQTVAEMKKLGVYKPEYDRIISLYAGLWEQYHRLSDEYEKDGRYDYKLLTLSTCEYSRTNGRMVVVAKLITPRESGNA